MIGTSVFEESNLDDPPGVAEGVEIPTGSKVNPVPLNYLLLEGGGKGHDGEVHSLAGSVIRLQKSTLEWDHLEKTA